MRLGGAKGPFTGYFWPVTALETAKNGVFP